VRYSPSEETWGFEHWSVAWRLIERVRNATSVSARKHMSRPSVGARKSVRGPTSGARKNESGTTESEERDDSPNEVQARHRP
jgi:hypothetical protein